MDTLRENDIERFRRMSANERMEAVFSTVNAGIRMQYARLRAKRPEALDDEIEATLRDWLKNERSNS